MAGVLLGSPMALVDGAAGREGSTALRKATGFWMQVVGERGAGATLWGWNCFAPHTGSVSGGTATSLGLGTLCWPPEDLGGFPVKFSMWFVLWAAGGMQLKVPEELAEGLAGGVCGPRSCLGRP